MRGFGFKPIKRKGTMGLLRLIRETKGGSEEAGQELLEYIGRLETSEQNLLDMIAEFHRKFDDPASFTPELPQYPTSNEQMQP